jgi:hypothetical protein
MTTPITRRGSLKALGTATVFAPALLRHAGAQTPPLPPLPNIPANDALLLQPTAGDPLAALFDIADRISHGRPYDYGVVTYARDGSVLARGPVQAPDVCLGCVRQGTPVAAARAVPTNAVDCSNASLTNSFCGASSGSVSISGPSPATPQVVYLPAPEPQTIYTYYPLYPGVFMGHSWSRFDRPIPTMRPAVASAFSIAPRLVSPSPGVLGRRP